MKKQNGITLVALIITIIVMLILAGIAISLVTVENGIITKTFQAEKKQTYATVKEKINAQCEYISEGENIGKIDLSKAESNIRSLNLEEVKEISSTPNVLIIKLKDDSIIEISGVNGKVNEYGFYYNVDYICNGYLGYGTPPDKFFARFLEDGTLEVKAYQYQYEVGDRIYFEDIIGTKILEIKSVEVNKLYTAIGALDSVYTWILNEDEVLTTNFAINKDKITCSYKNINIGGALNCIISEDGKSFNLNGKVFAIEE